MRHLLQTLHNHPCDTHRPFTTLRQNSGLIPNGEAGHRFPKGLRNAVGWLRGTKLPIAVVTEERIVVELVGWASHQRSALEADGTRPLNRQAA